MAPRASELSDVNQEIGILLLDLAEVHRPSPLPQFLSELTERDILKIPNVGPGTMRIVREFLDTGRSATVEKAVAESGKQNVIDERRALRRNFLSGAMVAKILTEPKRGAVKREDYLGDFQMHSQGSDGSDTIAALARACVTCMGAIRTGVVPILCRRSDQRDASGDKLLGLGLKDENFSGLTGV